jgi:hypothetical protein
MKGNLIALLRPRFHGDRGKRGKGKKGKRKSALSNLFPFSLLTFSPFLSLIHTKGFSFLI